MIDKIQMLHAKGLVHCDISPDNFYLHPNYQQKEFPEIYIANFSASKRYLEEPKPKKSSKNQQSPDKLVHIPFIETYKATHYAEYASLTQHSGVHPTRRSDYESLGYTLLYLLKGNLPWSHIETASLSVDQYNRKVKDIKFDANFKTLCSSQKLYEDEGKIMLY